MKVLDTSCFIKTTEKGEVLIDPLHKKIQNAVAKLIKKDNVHPYVETGLSDAEGQRVDIKGIFKETGEWHYFEIKTDSAKKASERLWDRFLNMPIIRICREQQIVHCRTTATR